MAFTPERLKRWTLPRCYVGAEWSDYYSSGFGRSRDSDCLEESNFDTIFRQLGGESETVVVVRESHWLVGWVEWIAIHKTDERALMIADQLRRRCDDYPVLDEDDFSSREYEAACATWEGMRIRDRIDAITRHGAGRWNDRPLAILQARFADLSRVDDPSGSLHQYLTTP